MRLARYGVVLALLTGCQAVPASRPSVPSAVPTTAAPGASPPQTTLRPTPSPTPTVVVVRYRLERRTRDPATAGFAALVQSTLTDPRGWLRAGFRFVLDQQAPYVIVLAEPDEVQQLCQPMDVYRKYSCQNGPVVALNAERWRTATPKWTGSLSSYRLMLVNHEVGHLLGLSHPPNPQCPRPGRLARIMSQQSTELNGCRPNPWPLESEITRAARHDLPLAPPPEPD